VQPRRANAPNQSLMLSRRWLVRLVGRDHFGVWFVIALIVRLVKGTLVPFLVAAPRSTNNCRQKPFWTLPG